MFLVRLLHEPRVCSSSSSCKLKIPTFTHLEERQEEQNKMAGRRATPILCALAIGFCCEDVLSAAEPAAPRLEFAFEELVLLGTALSPGKTPYGARNIIPITGGTFDGPGFRGTIMPGGWDWQLTRADGCIDVHADYMIRTDDGVIINVVNDGAICVPKAGEAPRPVRTSPRFEAPLGKYQWLGQTAFIGTLEVAKGPKGEPAVRLRFYKAT